MTEHKSPKDRILDLFVFGPAGLALTAAEEFPKLVEKGRHRVEGQLHTARLVGQFAVQMGRRQLESSLGGLRPGADPGSPPIHQHRPEAAGAGSPDGPPVAATGVESGMAQETAPVQRTTAGSDNGALASDALGIPGYDSLSASQVVQRLGGLTAGELEAIRDHELAHRHRRTILNRVEQLLGPTTAG